MKKNILNIIKIIVLVIIVLAVIVVVVKAFSSNDNNNELKDKTNQDLLYLENKLISIANKLNNISFGHYVISESKIEDNLVENQGNKSGEQSQNSEQQNTSNDNTQGSNNNNNNNNENQESSSAGEQQNVSNFGRENKIKYELKQDSVLTSEEKEIDWDFIKTNIELLYSNWAQTVIDLHSLNVDNQDILSFGRELDNLIVAAKNENKKETLKIVSNLYSYIPKYEQQFLDDTKNINIQYTKYYVLNSYYLVEDLKWNEIKKSLDSAQNYFSNVINSINGDGSDKDKISKIYVLINELDTSLNLQDKEVFYIKYKTLMEELSNL